MPLFKTLLEGVEMTEKQLAEVLKKYGIEKYDPTDEPFDPHRHDAVFQVSDPSKPPGTVAQVLKPGYVLHDNGALLQRCLHSNSSPQLDPTTFSLSSSRTVSNSTLDSSNNPSLFPANSTLSVSSSKTECLVTETLLPNSRVKLSVEVPRKVCNECYRKVIVEFMKQAKVPGFRPGKPVPESILISYVGKKGVDKAVVESI